MTKIMKEKLQHLADLDFSEAEAARIFNTTKSNINKYAGRLEIKLADGRKDQTQPFVDFGDLIEDWDNGMSVEELVVKYKVARHRVYYGLGLEERKEKPRA